MRLECYLYTFTMFLGRPWLGGSSLVAIGVPRGTRAVVRCAVLSVWVMVSSCENACLGVSRQEVVRLHSGDAALQYPASAGRKPGSSALVRSPASYPCRGGFRATGNAVWPRQTQMVALPAFQFENGKTLRRVPPIGCRPLLIALRSINWHLPRIGCSW